MHTSHQTTNSPKTTKSVPTQIYIKKKHTQTSNNIFEELVPSVLSLLKKARMVRTRWYRGPFRRFINTIFLKKSIKRKEKRNGQ